jgi:signal transduction histidine kinase
MLNAIKSLWTRFSLAQKFAVASAAILLPGMLGLGWWTDKTIEQGVTRITGANAALYMNSFIAPYVQELSKSDRLSPAAISILKGLMNDTPLGGRVVSIKVWSSKGQIVYSNQEALIGKIFPPDEALTAALQGNTDAELSELDEEENATERKLNQPILEIYSPVRDTETGKVIGAIEFYQLARNLQTELTAARFEIWRNVALGSLVIFGLLFALVREGSKTITTQQAQLETRVSQLSGLLARNKLLSARVREATNRATEINEQFLRRIRTDLHDGPAQGIGFALISFESLQKAMVGKTLNGAAAQTLSKVRSALEDALKEIRDLCGGMALPELDDFSLPQTVRRVVRAHEARTDTPVALDVGALPPETSLPLKINVYRFIQEGLNNAYRHGGGKDQKVAVSVGEDAVHVSISDQGGGFDVPSPETNGHHMGLVGMRKRVESFGGTFVLDNNVDGGVRVAGTFPLHEGSGADA